MIQKLLDHGADLNFEENDEGPVFESFMPLIIEENL